MPITIKTLSSMAEAISFISATLAEPFSTAQGIGLYWSTYKCSERNMYPVSVETLPGGKIKLAVGMDAIDDPIAVMRLYAIIGWATYHGHEWEHT